MNDELKSRLYAGWGKDCGSLLFFLFFLGGERTEKGKRQEKVNNYSGDGGVDQRVLIATIYIVFFSLARVDSFSLQSFVVIIIIILGLTTTRVYNNTRPDRTIIFSTAERSPSGAQRSKRQTVGVSRISRSRARWIRRSEHLHGWQCPELQSWSR